MISAPGHRPHREPASPDPDDVTIGHAHAYDRVDDAFGIELDCSAGAVGTRIAFNRSLSEAHQPRGQHRWSRDHARGTGRTGPAPHGEATL
jgi:hypothetical protein